MENNTFEGLQEVETIEPITDAAPALKEYEKLLLAEAGRKSYEKALSLVKAGCFSQEEVSSLDFSKLEKLSCEKKFKGLYQLYLNLETMELLFVLPLVENNKGDKDEAKDMKPYAYDVITTEYMDNETYDAVMKAASRNINDSVHRLYKASWILYWITIVFTVLGLVYLVIALIDGGILAFLQCMLYGAACVLTPIVATVLMALLTMKYKKYMGNK